MKFSKLFFIGDANSIHLKKWILFFTNDFDIKIISDTKLTNESKEFWKEKKIKVYDFNVNGNKIKKILNLIRKIFMYNLIILKNKKAIFHYHYIGLNVLISLPSLLLAKNKFFTFWGSDFNLAKGFQKLIIKIVSKIGNYITSDSTDILNKLEEKYNTKKDKLIYINHGVSEKIFYIKEKTNNNFIIFSPRALQPFYNHHILFKNIELLKQIFGNIKLVFIDYNTDKKYKKLLQEYINKYPDNIILLHSLTQQELANWYNQSDIVISIPQYDGMPVTLIESIFCKKPIILSNNKNYNKIVPIEFILKETNIENIISKIKYIKDNKNKIEQAIIKLQKEFIEKYSYNKNMEKMKRIYLTCK